MLHISSRYIKFHRIKIPFVKKENIEKNRIIKLADIFKKKAKKTFFKIFSTHVNSELFEIGL